MQQNKVHIPVLIIQITSEQYQNILFQHPCVKSWFFIHYILTLSSLFFFLHENDIIIFNYPYQSSVDIIMENIHFFCITNSKIKQLFSCIPFLVFTSARTCSTSARTCSCSSKINQERKINSSRKCELHICVEINYYMQFFCFYILQ